MEKRDDKRSPTYTRDFAQRKQSVLLNKDLKLSPLLRPDSSRLENRAKSINLYVPAPKNAVASISTNAPGEASAEMATNVEQGILPEKNSLRARPKAGRFSMSVR